MIVECREVMPEEVDSPSNELIGVCPYCGKTIVRKYSTYQCRWCSGYVDWELLDMLFRRK